MFLSTTATKKIKKLTARLRCVPGGTSASKTVSIMLYLIARCQRDKTPTLTSVVSESFPHLKRGVMRDFLLIMEQHGYFKPESWNKTNFTYNFETGSKLEFFSCDSASKIRGPRRNRLFINEANNIPFETFEQLEIRTDEFIFLDWNPVSEFWYYTELKGKRDDVEELTLTYKDNEALEPSIIASIEQRKSRPGWWKVYGEGQLGDIEGRIYTEWQFIDEIPYEARLERYGVDFGYHPDPVALVGVYWYNGGYILDEILYQREMKNPELASTLKNLPKALVIADSAEPKSIDEIKMFGINIIGAEKGKDSVRYGVKTLQNQRISVTKRSLNLIKEYRNYFQYVDRKTNIPVMGRYEGENHLLDASRYAICSLVPIILRKEFIRELPILNQPEVNPAL